MIEEPDHCQLVQLPGLLIWVEFHPEDDPAHYGAYEKLAEGYYKLIGFYDRIMKVYAPSAPTSNEAKSD